MSALPSDPAVPVGHDSHAGGNGQLAKFDMLELHDGPSFLGWSGPVRRCANRGRAEPVLRAGTGARVNRLGAEAQAR